MPATSPEAPRSSRDWRAARLAVDPALRQHVASTVDAVADLLSDRFYEHMLADEQARTFLDHAVVNRRLRASMANWLRRLFDPAMPDDEVLALQRRTGDVHARIGVPMELVDGAARLLKWETVSHLAQGKLPRAALAEAVQFVYERIGEAIDAMNSAWSASASRLDRSEEAYRLFFLNQNMKAERERQKSQLLEWAHQILFSGYWGTGPSPDAQPATPPQFGVWLQHKASILFDGAPELAHIHACVAEIEGELLPALALTRGQMEQARPVVTTLRQRIEEIKTHLGTMFDRYIESEDGHDTVTRALNRRYLPAVAKREIALALREQTRFGAVLVEIDRFEALREVLGLEGGDTVLSAVAEVLADSTRAGDFIFRLGDAQFLVLLVEVVPEALPGVAEGLRVQIESRRIRVSTAAATTVTATLGAVLFDGHPDYQHLLDRADAALKAARASGSNRWVVGD